jgi:hypothetical protein
VVLIREAVAMDKTESIVMSMLKLEEYFLDERGG